MAWIRDPFLAQPFKPDFNHKYDLICQGTRFKNQVIRFTKVTNKHKHHYTNEQVLLVLTDASACLRAPTHLSVHWSFLKSFRYRRLQHTVSSPLQLRRIEQDGTNDVYWTKTDDFRFLSWLITVILQFSQPPTKGKFFQQFCRNDVRIIFIGVYSCLRACKELACLQELIILVV